jgi:predicted Zn-dependent protease
MATKAKSSATANPVSAKGHENALSDKLSAALELFHGKKLKEAGVALNGLLVEAREAGHFGLVRTIQMTLASLEARNDPPEGSVDSPSLLASVLINRREGEAALEVLDKALKTDGANPRLNFLKATALAQLGKAEPSAEALEKAITGDPGMQVLFCLERDFDAVRYNPAFAAFEGD